VKRLTRDIDLADARDLLERAPRASLAYAQAAGPCALPIAFVWRHDRYFVGLPAPTDLQADQEVVLLIDEGMHFFDLRAVYLRGRVKPVDPPLNAPADQAWFEVLPTKVVAWDYGTLHEVTGEG